MPERRDNGARDRLDEIHRDYQRFSRRVWVALTVHGLVLVAGLAALGFLLDQNDDQADELRVLTEVADDRSREAFINATLARERVCSASTVGTIACRDLFNRLSLSISDEQRHQLACGVLGEMRGDVASELRRETRC